MSINSGVGSSALRIHTPSSLIVKISGVRSPWSTSPRLLDSELVKDDAWFERGKRKALIHCGLSSG
jgi:hypothetical protein